MSYEIASPGKHDEANGVGESLVTSNSARLTRGDLWRRGLAVLLPIVVLATGVSSTFDVETIVGWYPAGCLMAFVLAFCTLAMRSSLALVFALSVPLGVALCCIAIAVAGWGPRQAQGSISLIWWMFTIVHLALAIGGNQEIWKWRWVDHHTSPVRWQFQIRSILLLMVILSIVLVVGQELNISDSPDFSGFVYWSAGILLVAGIVFSLFLSNLQVAESEPGGNPWEDSPVEPSTEQTQL